MFKPSYQISSKLLSIIKQITVLTGDLNRRRYSQPVLVEMETRARAVSSHASTSIEGNPLPLTEVKEIIKSRPQNINISQREVLNYNQALMILKDRLGSRGKKFSFLITDFILEIHRQVMVDLLPDFQLGKFRKQPVVVHDPATGKILFLPPNPVDIDKLVGELVEFVNQNQKLDPVILAGLFHKQFVIIHPFMDGNGRTARLVNKALLAKMGVDTFSLFSFENYYNRNLTNYFYQVGVFGDYYELVKKIDFTPWLEYFALGILEEMKRVKKELSLVTLSPETELKDYHQKIIAFIKKKGFITNHDYAKLTDRAKPTRNLDFNKLIEMGLVVRRGKGKATFYKLKE